MCHRKFCVLEGKIGLISLLIYGRGIVPRPLSKFPQSSGTIKRPGHDNLTTLTLVTASKNALVTKTLFPTIGVLKTTSIHELFTYPWFSICMFARIRSKWVH